MKRWFLVCFLLLGTVVSSWAFTPQDVKGRVVDEQNQPLAFVNVVLLSLPDSTFVQGSTTDENGYFLLNTPVQKGIVRLSYIGYDTRCIQLPIPNDGVITLSSTPETLAEVVVKAALPKTKLEGDAMVTHIQNSVLEKAGTAADVLAKVPGMMRMGNQLQVIGKGTPVFYINGRKVQDAEELSRLQSQDIRKVEVVSNPGSQYDAEVTSVVRIKTVQSGEGFGGHVNVTDAQTLRHGNNLFNGQMNLNYRKNNVDVFGGLQLKHDYLRAYESVLDQHTYGTVNSYRQNGPFSVQGKDTRLVANGGFNWQIQENHSVGIRLEYGKTLKHDFDLLHPEDEIWVNNQLTSILSSCKHAQEKNSGSTLLNGYYNGQLGKWALDWNVDYYRWDKRQQEDIREKTTAYLSQNEIGSWMIATKLVGSRSIGKGTLTTGTEWSWVNRTNDYQINKAQVGNSNTLVKEDNRAFFAEYGTLTPYGMLNVGLRYEHQTFDYESRQDGHQTRYNDQFFPSVSFATRLAGVEAVLGYSIKTHRPTYDNLRSGLEYVNPFTFSTGNSTLKNEISQQVDLKMRWRIFALQATYRYQKHIIFDWSSPYDDQGTVLISVTNFTEPLKRYSAFLVASPTIGCWTSNHVVGIQGQNLSFLLDDPRENTGKRQVNYNKPMFIFNSNNAFRLPHSWQLELNSEFYSKAHFANTQLLENYWNLTAVVQKSWLKNEALTLRVSCGDIFQTAQHAVLIDLGNYLLHKTNIIGQDRSQFEQHRLTCSLQYKFNAVKSKYKGTGAGNAEKLRF